MGSFFKFSQGSSGNLIHTRNNLKLNIFLLQYNIIYIENDTLLKQRMYNFGIALL